MDRQFSAGGVVYQLKQKTSLDVNLRRNHGRKPMKLHRQQERGPVKWLVTCSRPSREFPKPVWRLPKGWLDDKGDGKLPGLFASGKKKASEGEVQTAAVREVQEEAGVAIEVVDKIGTETYFLTLEGKKVLKFVTFYLMKYVKDLPEGFRTDETSQVAWLEFGRARERLSYSGEKKILDKAREVLEEGVQRTLL